MLASLYIGQQLQHSYDPNASQINSAIVSRSGGGGAASEKGLTTRHQSDHLDSDKGIIE